MIKIAFTGDISLNDRYTVLAEQGMDPFQHIRPILERNDLVAGNLEAMVGGDGENLRKSPRLKTSRTALGYLKALNFSIVTLAHNHVYDNLESGFANTTRCLDEIGIQYLGAGTDTENAGRPLLIIRDNKTFAFFSFVDPDTRPDLPEEAGIRLNLLEENAVIVSLAAVQADFKIVLLHWGGKFEGGYYPGMEQQRLARSIIRAGADLVVGHHSHTLQPMETYLGKKIFYSLGNFCFADIRHEGGIQSVSLQRYSRSAILECTFEETTINCSLQPFYGRELVLYPAGAAQFRGIRRRQAIFSLMNALPIVWFYYYFHFRYIRPVVQLFLKEDERSLGRRIREFRFGKLVKMFKQ